MGRHVARASRTPLGLPGADARLGFRPPRRGFRRVKIFVNEYPKSGGSWLVNLLGDALGLPKRDIYVADGYDQFAIAKHPWYRGTGHLGVEAAGDCVVKSHERPGSALHRPFESETAHLCLVRDGRDVVVSKYFFERDFCVQNGILARFDATLEDYVPRTAAEWAAHVSAWLDAGVPVLRYERFLADPHAALREACERAGHPGVADDRIAAAVAGNTPEHMRRSLADAFAHNTFVRKATSGDWRNHLTAAHAAAFHAAAGPVLARLGYVD